MELAANGRVLPMVGNYSVRREQLLIEIILMKLRINAQRGLSRRN